MKHRKGYQFTNKRHSKKAVMSTVYGALGLTCLVTVLYLSYRSGGEAPVKYGVAGVLVTLFALIGLLLGVLAAREKDRYRFFAVLGLILNGVTLAGVSGVLYMGAYL